MCGLYKTSEYPPGVINLAQRLRSSMDIFCAAAIVYAPQKSLCHSEACNYAEDDNSNADPHGIHPQGEGRRH